MAGLNLVEVE